MSTATESVEKENMDIKFIKSNKGQLLLVLSDYMYWCNKKIAHKKYWICTRLNN